MEPVTLALPDPEATEALGEALGARLCAGQALALVGELGAGKTCVARGVARGLRLDDPEEVCSPTYLLVVEHPGPVPMVHVDAYLPDKTRGFLLDGGVDYLASVGGVVVVEWADRIADLMPPETLWLRLARGEGTTDTRRAVLDPRGHAAFGWIADLAGAPGQR